MIKHISIKLILGACMFVFIPTLHSTLIVSSEKQLIVSSYLTSVEYETIGKEIKEMREAHRFSGKTGAKTASINYL